MFAISPGFFQCARPINGSSAARKAHAQAGCFALRTALGYFQRVRYPVRIVAESNKGGLYSEKNRH